MEAYILKFITCLCYVAFLSQFVTLTHDYLMYKTITKYQFYCDNFISVPTITFAFTSPVQAYDLYFAVFRNKTKASDYNFPQLSDIARRYWNQTRTFPPFTFLSQFQNLVTAVYSQAELSKLLNQEFFNEIYLQQFQISYCYNGTANSMEFYDEMPNFSLGNAGIFGVSYFSDFAKKPPFCTKMHKKTNIRVIFNKYRFYHYVPYYFTIGGGSVVPHSQQLTPVLANTFHNVYYTRAVMNRLQAPYETRCESYEESKFRDSLSKSDCIARCAFERVALASNDSFNEYFGVSAYMVMAKLIPAGTKLGSLLEQAFSLSKKKINWLLTLTNKLIV